MKRAHSASLNRHAIDYKVYKDKPHQNLYTPKSQVLKKVSDIKSMSMLRKSLLLLLFPSVLWAMGPGVIIDCTGPYNVDRNLYKNLNDIKYILEPEEAPFNFACKSANATQGRPKTSLFKREVPEKDSAGHLSSDFLKILVAKVRAKITENRNIATAVKRCSNSAAAACSELRSWVKDAVPDYVGTMRFHLSLAQSPYQAKTWIGQTSTRPNSDLDSLGSPKIKPWKPLNKHEKSQALKAFKIYQDQISTENPKASIKEKREALLLLRYQHFEQYQAMLAELPFIQYIDSEKPTEKDILTAVNELEKNLAKEEAALDEFSSALKQNPPGTGALDLLKYSTLVEEVLLETPQYCAIATSLVYTSDNREMGNSLAIGLPILAVSFLAPPLAIALGASGAVATGVGVGVAVTSSVGFIYDSQRLLDQERIRSYSQFYGDPAGLEDEQVRVAEAMRDYTVVTAPLALSGAGALGKSLLIPKSVQRMASKIPLATRNP